MAAEKQIQRWTAKRRSALVLSILRGVTSAQEAARKHGLTVAENIIYRWKSQFGGVEISEAKRLQELEEENARLKKLLPEPNWTSRR